MYNKLKINLATELLEDTINFFNDGGFEIMIGYHNQSEKDVIDTYNLALGKINERFKILKQFIEEDNEPKKSVEKTFNIQMLNSPEFNLYDKLHRKLAVKYLLKTFEAFVDKDNKKGLLRLKEDVVVSKTELSMRFAELITMIEFKEFDSIKDFECKYTNLDLKVL